MTDFDAQTKLVTQLKNRVEILEARVDSIYKAFQDLEKEMDEDASKEAQTPPPDPPKLRNRGGVPKEAPGSDRGDAPERRVLGDRGVPGERT